MDALARSGTYPTSTSRLSTFSEETSERPRSARTPKAPNARPEYRYRVNAPRHPDPSPSFGRPAAIVFDVDGTLYHQRPLRAAMLLRLARYAVRRPRDGARCLRVLRAYRAAQETLRLSDDPHPGRQVEVAALTCGTHATEVRTLVERWMEQEPLALLPRVARRGLRDFLERARAAGVRLGVFSDYPAAAKLSALGVGHLFNEVWCAQDDAVARFKPDATGLLLVAQALRVAPAETVYVGDRADVDGLAARRAGMGCAIFADRAPAGADWTAVRSFRHLGDLLLDADPRVG